MIAPVDWSAPACANAFTLLAISFMLRSRIRDPLLTTCLNLEATSSCFSGLVAWYHSSLWARCGGQTEAESINKWRVHLLGGDKWGGLHGLLDEEKRAGVRQ
jgi:hypothetical protein